MVAAGVRFVTHDGSFSVLSGLGIGRFPERVGCIEIMDNVFIGYNATILPNARIGSNVIVGAGSIVTRDLESNGVYVGIPAKNIASFDDFVRKQSPNQDGKYTYPTVKKNQKISEDEIKTA